MLHTFKSTEASMVDNTVYALTHKEAGLEKAMLTLSLHCPKDGGENYTPLSSLPSSYSVLNKKVHGGAYTLHF
jgi:hypothetical protein